MDLRLQAVWALECATIFCRLIKMKSLFLMRRNNQTLLHINTGSILYTSFRLTGKFRYYLIVGMSSFEYAMVCLYPKDELNIDVEFVRNLKIIFYGIPFRIPEQELLLIAHAL